MRKNVKKITPEDKRLKFLLKQEGIKQKEFAKLIGMAPSSVSDFIHGRMKGGGGIKFWDGIRGAFPTWENEIRDYVGLPPEDLQDAAGSTFGIKGIVIQGYEFQNKEIIMGCVDLLWNIEQIDPDIFAHAQTYLGVLLDCAGVVSKKINRRSSG